MGSLLMVKATLTMNHRSQQYSPLAIEDKEALIPQIQEYRVPVLLASLLEPQAVSRNEYLPLKKTIY